MTDDRYMDFAYMSFSGCSEASMSEVEAYISSVESEVIPGIDAILQAKDEGAHQACAVLVF